jgi:hypothetical protein
MTHFDPVPGDRLFAQENNKFVYEVVRRLKPAKNGCPRVVVKVVGDRLGCAQAAKDVRFWSGLTFQVLTSKMKPAVEA